MHPQPRVRFVVGVCTRVFTAEAPETSGIPHAMVLRLISRSPRGPGSFAPVTFAGIVPCENLAPASGRQDHTILPSASGALVKRAAASTASRSASVTLRNAPLSGAGPNRYSADLGLASRENSEIRKLDRAIRVESQHSGSQNYDDRRHCSGASELTRNAEKNAENSHTTLLPAASVHTTGSVLNTRGRVSCLR